MKKLLTILVLIMLIISFFQITRMYALYKEQIQGEYSSLLGVWAIKINNTLITEPEGQTEGFVIDKETQLGYVDSEYIQAGKIAPGGQAYFDLVIDPTDNDGAYTDVSIVYQIDIGSDTTANAKIELISGENYFQKDGEIDQVANDVDTKDGNSYTSVIPVEKITQGYKNYVRLYFKWVNEESSNVTDSTLLGTEDATISIPLQINLKQYMGEEIGNESE